MSTSLPGPAVPWATDPNNRGLLAPYLESTAPISSLCSRRRSSARLLNVLVTFRFYGGGSDGWSIAVGIVAPNQIARAISAGRHSGVDVGMEVFRETNRSAENVRQIANALAGRPSRCSDPSQPTGAGAPTTRASVTGENSYRAGRCHQRDHRGERIGVGADQLC